MEAQRFDSLVRLFGVRHRRRRVVPLLVAGALLGRGGASGRAQSPVSIVCAACVEICEEGIGRGCASAIDRVCKLLKTPRLRVPCQFAATPICLAAQAMGNPCPQLCEVARQCDASMIGEPDQPVPTVPLPGTCDPPCMLGETCQDGVCSCGVPLHRCRIDEMCFGSFCLCRFGLRCADGSCASDWCCPENPCCAATAVCAPGEFCCPHADGTTGCCPASHPVCDTGQLGPSGFGYMCCPAGSLPCGLPGQIGVCCGPDEDCVANDFASPLCLAKYS